MKFSNFQLAQYLFDLSSSGIEGDELKINLREFVLYLRKTRMMSKVNSILRSYNDLVRKKGGRKEILLELASEEPEIIQRITDKVIPRIIGKGKNFRVKVCADKRIIGGYRLCYQDFLIDASVRRQLRSIRQLVTR